ncbi:class I SAM-dependent DNA methyltransferase [Azospirillum argentinense]
MNCFSSARLDPAHFIKKWKAVELKERSAAQSHFNDLCQLLGEKTPTDADPKGAWYCFERGATKTGGGEGWADVWKREHFGWEYKGKRKDLDAAFEQLQRYALALENPPLLIVSDMDRFRIHTNWTNTVSRRIDLTLDDLADPQALQTLKWAFAQPDKLKPGLTREALTRDAARRFAALALALRARGHEPMGVAQFINRLIFCMFAEDCDLLPNKLFSRMLDVAADEPQRFVSMVRELFAAMKSGGSAGWESVRWFNGGLFKDDRAIPLTAAEIAGLGEAARLDWSGIDPSIFGTLFEGGLDPDKRSQLGAHYTDADKIRQIVRSVVEQPLLREWEVEKDRIAAALARTAKARSPSARSKAHNEADRILRVFLNRLRRFRLLDPACGSGNFLYLGLIALKDLEHRVSIEAEAMGLQREFPQVGPEAVLGLEINPYAAELARVSVWIGDIQWMQRNGFGMNKEPILRTLDTIRIQDAVLAPDGSEPEWPIADAIIGNPPFLGDKMMRDRLGNDYVTRLRSLYQGRVPGGADLVCYWFEKARAWLASPTKTGQAGERKVGLVATNSIRFGANRSVLDRVREHARIFEAWADEPWVVDGAAVRVSLVCFGQGEDTPVRLDEQPVAEIFADLSAGEMDLTKAVKLMENQGVCFQGPVKVGAFDIDGVQARQWLTAPGNPNGRPNADVVRPWINGMDIVRRPSDTWIVDFAERDEAAAAFYEAPFEHVRTVVKPSRDMNRRDRRRIKWWQHGETVPGLRRALAGVNRYIATPRVAKHRLFVWSDASVLPDSRVNAIIRDDDMFFGILHSRFHELWALALGGWHGAGNDPQYTPSTSFETFPFPEGLTPDQPAGNCAADPRAQAIATMARRLDQLRRRWLNPDELVRMVPEAVSRFPDRIVPRDAQAAVVLKKRTLTNLYNDRPTWLVNAHRDLDAAVAAAYGWPADISDDEVLKRLLGMNRQRMAGVAVAASSLREECA